MLRESAKAFSLFFFLDRFSMLYLKDIKEQERRNGDKLTFLQKKMKKLKRKNYQDNDFIKWIKQKYNNKDSGLFTHLYCQILLKIYLCGVNALVLIYCARLVRRKRALIKQIKKSPQKYTEILLKADQLVWCLIHNDRPCLIDQFIQDFPAFFFVHWKKSFESKSPGRKP